MAKDYVHKFLWKDHSQPFLTAWQLTLTDDEAIGLVGAVSVLLAFTQTRAWSLQRKAVKRIVRPIQLPGDEDKPLRYISQGEAVSGLIYYISTGRQTSAQIPRSMTSVSPWFGMVAIVNAVLFLGMGIAVPWLLTGGLETPIVQSKPWRQCNEFNPPQSAFWGYDAALAASRLWYDCWFNATGKEVRETCDRQRGFLMEHPKVHITLDADCPFAPEACHNRTAAIRLEYQNLTFRDFGFNREGYLGYSRRLTCSPLAPERYMYSTSGQHSYLALASVDNRRGQGLRLRFPDGRGPERSWGDGSNRQFHFHTRVFPWWPPISASSLHPDFTAPDALDGQQTFFYYSFDQDEAYVPDYDPIYSTRQTGSEPEFVDYEYRIIGCIEQHSFCYHENRMYALHALFQPGVPQ